MSAPEEEGARVQRLLTADDVALVLGVPKSLIYALVRRGELPAIRVGERYVRFRADAISRWIENREAGGQQTAGINGDRRRPHAVG
jgi:excisionase family DNA binding protein